MKLKYIGDKDSVAPYGIEFVKGEVVEVDEKTVAYTTKRLNPPKVVTAYVVDKLKANPDFEQVKNKPGPKPKVAHDDASGNTQSGTE